MMAIVDADYNFQFIDVGAEGGDASIFARSSLGSAILNRTIETREPKPIPNGAILPHVFFAGVSFPLKMKIMRSFLGGSWRYCSSNFIDAQSRNWAIVPRTWRTLVSDSWLQWQQVRDLTVRSYFHGNKDEIYGIRPVRARYPTMAGVVPEIYENSLSQAFPLEEFWKEGAIILANYVSSENTSKIEERIGKVKLHHLDQTLKEKLRRLLEMYGRTYTQSTYDVGQNIIMEAEIDINPDIPIPKAILKTSIIKPGRSPYQSPFFIIINSVNGDNSEQSQLDITNSRFLIVVCNVNQAIRRSAWSLTRVDDILSTIDPQMNPGKVEELQENWNIVPWRQKEIDRLILWERILCRMPPPEEGRKSNAQVLQLMIPKQKTICDSHIVLRKASFPSCSYAAFTEDKSAINQLWERTVTTLSSAFAAVLDQDTNIFASPSSGPVTLNVGPEFFLSTADVAKEDVFARVKMRVIALITVPIRTFAVMSPRALPRKRFLSMVKKLWRRRYFQTHQNKKQHGYGGTK
ncbi:hypothetical protein QYM36_019144 [Artemia franciscana]|uniref:Uncharacterized protein n=1 Tax=Artemia franciscana TaxID=6661 RepID=A0AA88KTA3_ARTSF|nr:hypothetical protein QYM36_019144 [Artemia franciscana]